MPQEGSHLPRVTWHISEKSPASALRPAARPRKDTGRLCAGALAGEGRSDRPGDTWWTCSRASLWPLPTCLHRLHMGAELPPARLHSSAHPGSQVPSPTAPVWSRSWGQPARRGALLSSLMRNLTGALLCHTGAWEWFLEGWAELVWVNKCWQPAGEQSWFRVLGWASGGWVGGKGDRRAQ